MQCQGPRDLMDSAVKFVSRHACIAHVHVPTTHAHRPWHVHGNMIPALFSSMQFVAACMQFACLASLMAQYNVYWPKVQIDLVQ